jgi:hypothetical protein
MYLPWGECYIEWRQQSPLSLNALHSRIGYPFETCCNISGTLQVQDGTMKKDLPKQDSHLLSETKFCLGENCVPSEDYSIMASLEMCYQAYMAMSHNQHWSQKTKCSVAIIKPPYCSNSLQQTIVIEPCQAFCQYAFWVTWAGYHKHCMFKSPWFIHVVKVIWRMRQNMTFKRPTHLHAKMLKV